MTGRARVCACVCLQQPNGEEGGAEKRKGGKSWVRPTESKWRSERGKWLGGGDALIFLVCSLHPPVRRRDFREEDERCGGAFIYGDVVNLGMPKR